MTLCYVIKHMLLTCFHFIITMENFQNQSASSTGTTLTAIVALTSNTILALTIVGSVTDNKGKQPEVLTLKKINIDDRKKSQIQDHFTKLDGNPKALRAKCNYYGNDYACHTIINCTSNILSHLKVCKKFPFVVNRKQKVLVLEPEKEKGESGDRNVGTLKAISHNYDE